MINRYKSSTVSDTFPMLLLAVAAAMVLYQLAFVPVPPAADCPTGGSIVVGLGISDLDQVAGRKSPPLTADVRSSAK